MSNQVLSIVRPIARHWLPRGSTCTSGACTDTSARVLDSWVSGTVMIKVGTGVAAFAGPVRVGKPVKVRIGSGVGVTVEAAVGVCVALAVTVTVGVTVLLTVGVNVVV